MVNTALLTRFINRAERVWLNVVDSAWPYRGNVKEYALLPKRFDSRLKVLRYFQHYWGRSIANRMLINLRTKKVNGRLYVPQGDPPPLPVTVKKLWWSRPLRNKLIVHALLSGSPDGLQKVTYTMRKDCKGKWKITGRTKRNGDVRYKRSKK